MPKRKIEELHGQTVRVAPATSHWLQNFAAATGRSQARILRGIIEDAESWYGLPSPLVAALIADRDSRGLGVYETRKYIMEVLTEQALRCVGCTSVA